MHARFPRRIEALAQVFEFTEAFCAQHGEITHDCALALDFAVEELFTNLVKYQPGEAPVEIELCLEDGPQGRADVAMRAACVTITGPERHPFDPCVVPDASIDRPALERQPGGLGLHLVRRLVAGLEYRHDPQTGIGCTRLRVALPPAGHGHD